MTTSSTFAINTHMQLAPCRAATNALTDNYTSYVYDNGISNDGNGATLALAGANFIIDGATIILQDRVVINLPTNKAYNGIYVCTQEYDPSLGHLSAILTRSGDMQSASQVAPGSYCYITDGTLNAGEYIMVGSPIPSPALGLAALSFVVGSTKGSVISSTRVVSASNIQLTAASPVYEFINPTANIDVLLPGTPTTGMFFLIKNIPFSAFNITVKDFGGVQLGLPLPNGVSQGYFFDGTQWQEI